jgi:hypothetical protein
MTATDATGPTTRAAEPAAGVSRRAVLLGGALAGLSLLVPPRPARAASGVYLDDGELTTLRAVVGRVVPTDVDPGAVEGGVAEAIDALLGAFTVDPPLIYAGAPFSDRGGAPRNDFATPLPLDPYEHMAFRLLLEGSGGARELERNGPVQGLQAVYREGLRALDEQAAPAGFAALPAPLQDAALRADDPRIAALVDVAVPQTFELFYGAPEYGGNRDLVGWGFTTYDGDVLPRGYTAEEIETHSPRDGGGALPAPTALPLPLLATAAAFATREAVDGARADGVGRLSPLQSALRAAVAGAEAGTS